MKYIIFLTLAISPTIAFAQQTTNPSKSSGCPSQYTSLDELPQGAELTPECLQELRQKEIDEAPVKADAARKNAEREAREKNDDQKQDAYESLLKSKVEKDDIWTGAMQWGSSGFTAAKVMQVLDGNIYGYFRESLSEFSTDLKRKEYSRSTEYQEYVGKLKQIKHIVLTNPFYYTFNEFSDYDVKTGSFYVKSEGHDWGDRVCVRTPRIEYYDEGTLTYTITYLPKELLEGVVFPKSNPRILKRGCNEIRVRVPSSEALRIEENSRKVLDISFKILGKKKYPAHADASLNNRVKSLSMEFDYLEAIIEKIRIRDGQTGMIIWSGN